MHGSVVYWHDAALTTSFLAHAKKLDQKTRNAEIGGSIKPFFFLKEKKALAERKELKLMKERLERRFGIPPRPIIDLNNTSQL